MAVVEFLFPTLILLAIYALAMRYLYKHLASSDLGAAFFKATTPGAMLTVVNSGGVYLIVLAISAQYSASGKEFAYNVAAATFGLALGWILGIVISPSSKDEQSEFSLLTKAVSTFLTGYVLGYIKDITIENIQHFFARPGVPFRLLIGLACCFSTVAVVFVSRRAETMRANAARDWFISYTPADPRHAQGLRPDLLARGPFASKEEAEAEIARLKLLDEFKGVDFAAVRVDLINDEPIVVNAPPPTGGDGAKSSQTATSDTDAADQQPGQPLVGTMLSPSSDTTKDGASSGSLNIVRRGHFD